MISGPYGFAERFAEYGYDQDVLTEYFTTISNIHGIITKEQDNSLTFSYSLNNIVHPLLTFENGTCTIASLPICKASEEFLIDITADIPQTSTDFDSTILAIYRFVHAIKNSDLH